MNTDAGTIIFVYEVRQSVFLKKILASFSEQERKEITVIALGLDVEYALQNEEIAFESGRVLRSVSHPDSLGQAEKIGRLILDDPTCSFFTYRGIPLQDIFLTGFQSYLSFLFYFIDVFTSVAELYPEHKRLIVFPSPGTFSKTAGVMAPLQKSVAIDAARLVGRKFGVEISVPSIESKADKLRDLFHLAIFNTKRTLFGIILTFLNLLVTVRVKKRHLTLLATDYWRNLAPLLSELPEAEVFLLDRSESRNAGFANILKHRMRFVHVEQFAPFKTGRHALHEADRFLSEWEKHGNRNRPLQEALFRGHPLTQILEKALTLILARGGERAVSAIDGSFALMERIKPGALLVRASASAQIHFSILCHVARTLGIPSIELQHGLMYIGGTSFIRRPAAEHIATYGPLESEEFSKLGYASLDNMLSVGSPRFDVYRKMRERAPYTPQEDVFNISCVVPAVHPESWADSYEIEEFLKEIAEAASRIPNAHVTLKLRPDPYDMEFYGRVIREIYATIPHTVAQYEPMVDIIEKTDVFVTIYSTTVFEGLISGRPTIYSGTLEMHAELGKELEEHVRSGALSMIHTKEELIDNLSTLAANVEKRIDLVKKADDFMKKRYSFDGNSSQRLAEEIRTLSVRMLTAKPH